MAAAQIRGRSSSLQELVANTLATIAAVDARATPGATFDASALGYFESGRGLCIAHANLFCALMRANGVAARPEAVILRGLNQGMHFQAEYFVPQRGWVHVEPEGRDIQSPRWQSLRIGPVYSEPSFHVPSSLDNPTKQPGDVYVDHLFPLEIDAAGHIVPEAASKLTISNGLFVPGGPYPGLLAHAAG